MNLPYIVITAVTFIVILFILVLVHELGHFLTARLFKVRVEEFGLGFPPRLYPSRDVAQRRRAAGKTVYSLNALPLGGFVRLAGENGVTASTTGRGAGAGESSEPAGTGTGTTTGGESASAGRRYGTLALGGAGAAADDPGAFANKPGWQRAIILSAGAFNNMVLAMALLFATFAFIGTPHYGVAVIGIAAGSPAVQSGIAPGDLITRVDGQAPQDTNDVRTIVAAHPAQLVQLQLFRAGQTKSVTLIPRSATGLPCDQGPIGIMTNPVNQHYVPVDPGRAASLALGVPGTVVQGIVGLFSGLGNNGPAGTALLPACGDHSAYLTYGGRTVDSEQLLRLRAPGAASEDPCFAASANDSGISGPIGILKQVGCEANAVPQQGVVPLLLLVVELSATLAIVNLLPVPALDGGRLLFVLISLVARRRVRPEVEGMAHALGMIALLTLMLFVSLHDLTGHWF